MHGWPETKRIYWRVIEPLAAAGFDVVVPDLRGFGDSDVAPDGFHDVAAHVRDLHALVTDGLGIERVVLCGGDLGGPVVQRWRSPTPSSSSGSCSSTRRCPTTRSGWPAWRSRPAAEAADYFVRQGLDADGLAADLASPEQRRRYIATFYTSRFWAHPGAFMGDAPAVFGPFGGTPQVDFHTEPFGDAAKLRASFGGYESVFDQGKQSEPSPLTRNEDVRALLLFGTSDHVIYPAFDEMAAVVFPDHDGPHRLDGCGHFVPWEASGRLVEHVTRFCADLLA